MKGLVAIAQTCIVLLLVTALAWGNNAAFTIVRSDAESIDLRISVPPINFDKVNVAGKAWDRLRIPDYSAIGKPGVPQLPVISTFVSIPEGMKAEIQKTTVGTPRIVRGYEVAPAPNYESRPEFIQDATVYGRNALYPGKIAELSHPSGFRDYWVARINVCPVQYNPQLGELQIYDSIDVSIRYVADGKPINERSKPFGPAPPVFQFLYDHMMVKGNGADSKAVPAAPMGGSGYVNLLVITPQAFQSAVMPLINYHVSQSPLFQYEVRTLESIGGTNPQAIRNFIQNFYFANNLYSVLLVGDHEQLPAFRTNLAPPYRTDLNGDFFYAALDGSTSYVFSSNYPQVPEWGGDDTRDITIGRLSGTSSSEISMLVNKILTYRQTPPSGNWPSQHLFVASRNNNGQWHDYKAVKDTIILNSGSWQSNPSFYIVYGDYPSGTNANVKYVINSFHVGTVNYRGHGGPWAWDSWSYLAEYFTRDDVSGLVNGNYTPVIFNIGCSVGRFYGDTCQAESWVRNTNGGAVGTLAAVADTLPSYNDTLDQWLYKYIFEYRWNIGDAHLAAIIAASNYDSNAYTWFGDPLMGVRSLPISAAPATISSAESSRPKENQLWSNYPNPSNPETWIPYSLKQEADVTVEIYSLDGKRVRNIPVGRKPAGHHVAKQQSVYWDGRNDSGERVSSGVYFYTLKVDGKAVATQRLSLIK